MFDDPYDGLREQASQLQDQGDIRGALGLWREISLRCPDSEALCSLANAAQQLGEMKEAESALLKAVEADPELRAPYMMLCRSAISQGRWDDAELRARQALRIEEGADGHNLLGIILDVLDRAEESHAAFSRGIQLDPSYEELYCNFGQLVRRSDPAQAESLLCEAIDLKPDYAEAHRELGSLLLRQNVMDEAEYHLRRAIELDPADTWAHLSLGNLLWARKDTQAAFVEFRWAYESAPEWGVTMWCLADWYAAQEEWAKAEDLYHRALVVEPDNIAANRGLGKMYMSLGKTELAQTYLGRVLMLDPNDRSAREATERITDEYGGIPQNLVRRLRRRQSRWGRRQDRI